MIMKNFKIFIILLSFQALYSQNNYPPTGPVTFDTKLNLGNQIAPPSTPGETIRLSITPYGHTGGPWHFKARDNASLAFLDIDYGTTGSALTINSDKNIGIGVTNPFQKLEVNGNGLFTGAVISSISSDTGGKIQLNNPSKTANQTASIWAIYNMTGGYGNSLQFWAYDNLGCGSGMCNNRFTIMDNGNVGIGITNPLNKLDVNGTVHSKEVKVDMTGWSDFVFKKEYNLPTLAEVEKHITEKGHLENIPSEEEVLKNGINLGEMNSKLLQKIEELTLYIIKQNKKISSQENKIEELEKEKTVLKSLSERLLKIEEQLK